MVFLVVIFFMSVSFAPLSASQREAYRIPPRRPAFSYHLRVEVSSSGSGRNVLVHAEEIRRIVPGFYLLETAVVRAVGSFDAGRAFFHHEIDVSTGGRVRVDGVPIGAGPIGDLVLVGGIGVDAHDHCRPFGAAIAESGRTGSHAVYRAVDGVEVHGAEHGGHVGAVLDVAGDRIITQVVDEIGLPIPLHAGRVETIEEALQDGQGHGADTVEQGLGPTGGGLQEFGGAVDVFG